MVDLLVIHWKTCNILATVLCLSVGVSKQKGSHRRRMLPGVMLCEHICKLSFGQLLVKQLST